MLVLIILTDIGVQERNSNLQTNNKDNCINIKLWINLRKFVIKPTFQICPCLTQGIHS